MYIDRNIWLLQSYHFHIISNQKNTGFYKNISIQPSKTIKKEAKKEKFSETASFKLFSKRQVQFLPKSLSNFQIRPSSIFPTNHFRQTSRESLMFSSIFPVITSPNQKTKNTGVFLGILTIGLSQSCIFIRAT